MIRRAAAIAGLASLVLAALPAVAAAESPACATRVNNTFEKLLECVTLEGVREHQAAFQAIADANGGIRAAGTAGYTESVEYVVERLEAAGWQVSLDEFPYEYQAPALLQQLTPVTATYATGAFTGTGTGDVTGNVIPVDINLVPPRASTSGCEAADFAGLDFSGPYDIALIQRGTCSFAIKALNAQAAGAEAVVIFNQGNEPTREGLIIGTLAPDTAGIPVVGASFADGAALAQAGSTAHVRVDPPESRPQVNVLAELPGRSDTVVMAGAHLDSVQEGPGINDNGSGSAALIEVAEQMSKVTPRNTVRLAWCCSSTTVTTPTQKASAPGPTARHRSRRRSSASSPPSASPPRGPTSAGGRTTGRSSPRASQRAGCSPGPRGSSRSRRRPSGVAPRGSPTTPATTWPATPSTTTATPRLT